MRYALAVSIFLALSLAAGRVEARCLPRDDMAAELKRRYGEENVGFGVSKNGAAILELFVAESGTWTVLVTRTDGVSCISAYGKDWTGTPLRPGQRL